MMDEKEIEAVVNMCQRLEPVIQRFILGLLERSGPNVTLSVVSNLATSFMAQAIGMVDGRGGDVDEFVKVLMHETKNKYDHARAQAESDATLKKIMTLSRDQKGPMH
jgi:hypothetical protein